MKLLLTNFHAGDGGGHTTYLLALARGLVARHEVHIAAPAGSRLLREAAAIDGVRAHAQAFPNGLRRWRARRRARRALIAYLRAHAFDVVHVNGSADHRLVLSALRGLPRRPRVVLTKHNSKPMRGLGHWWRARATDLVIAVSAHTRRELEASAYARCRLATVHNGVDLQRYAPPDAAAAHAARARWSLPAQALVLGSNAGSAAYKGWMDLVEALALLPEDARGQVHLVVAGHPPPDDARRRIDALGLAAQVHFPGLLEDVRPAIAAFDAGFVLSYAVETISFACREMMAMARPALVSDYAGLPENVEAGVDGWIVPVRDRRAIADAVQRLLDRRDALPAMGLAARAHAEREFGLELFVERTEAAYREALQGDADAR